MLPSPRVQPLQVKITIADWVAAGRSNVNTREVRPIPVAGSWTHEDPQMGPMPVNKTELTSSRVLVSNDVPRSSSTSLEQGRITAPRCDGARKQTVGMGNGLARFSVRKGKPSGDGYRIGSKTLQAPSLCMKIIGDYAIGQQKSHSMLLYELELEGLESLDVDL